MRILIADDHAIVRKGIRQLLVEEYPSAIIAEVGDSESLISKTNTENWDVVICDLDMPGRSGLDAMQQIRAMHPKLPVLIMSIYPEEQYARRLLKAGAAGYLSKDAATEDLAKAVRQVLQGRKYISPAVAQMIADDFGQDGTDKASHESLSNREFEIFKLIASGMSVSEIADKLSLSSATISTHRARILVKMNLRTNAELTRYALDNKLI
ncbi:MAG TPA: response regulator transcription factor [Puia sp.]|jgi:two-component system invasion response regulator UvrY|nr:response regulator transcription factor [Puia sp.]